MQRTVLALGATLIWAAAASPSPASASAQDHVKAKHAKRIHVRCQKKAQGVAKKAKRVVETTSKTTTEPRAKQKAKHVAKRSPRLLEKTNKSSLALAESGHGAVNATNGAKLESPDTANALVALAMRYDGNNPTGWSHNWCAHYLNVVLQEAGYPSGGNLAREYASYGQPTPARVGAIAVIPHHVGVVGFVGDDYVILVSGNHGGSSGHRTVGLGRYAMSRITTFRMPLASEAIMEDEPKLASVKG